MWKRDPGCRRAPRGIVSSADPLVGAALVVAFEIILIYMEAIRYVAYLFWISLHLWQYQIFSRMKKKIAPTHNIIDPT